MIVLDSSAMLAYLTGEEGGEIVRQLFFDEERDVPIYAHAVNLCEVFYGLTRSQGLEAAESAIADLKAAGLIERNDMDADFWRDIAALIVARRSRSTGGTLALGDAFGVALTRRESGTFYTCDRSELAPVEAGGWCDVLFLR